MNIIDVDFNQINKGDYSVFSDIAERKVSGYIIRNFFQQEQLDILKGIFVNFPSPHFKPYDGFLSLPRPFNFIFKTSKQEHQVECDYMFDALKKSGIQQAFHQNISKFSDDTKIIYSESGQENSFSKCWGAVRKLEPEYGMFEIHCGRLFQGANPVFYNFFRQIANVDIQMTFLLMVQKPEIVDSDINIYEAHWEDIGHKINEETLRYNNGNDVLLKDLPYKKVLLNAGDILIFDEGNYWHAVPEFQGKIPRISFGGFITKYKHEDAIQIWV